MSRVNRIRIERIMGIDELEIEPGDVTIIEGGNGVGKTSILEAVRSMVGGGYDATLVRRGSEEGRTVLVLDDEIEVEKRIRASGGGDVSVRHPDLGKVSAPQSYLTGATDQLGLNPVAFLTAKNRAELLLEALPMTVSADQLQGTGVTEEIVEGIDLGAHALQVIDQVHKRVYDERTGVNRVEKDKRTTAEQLQEGLEDSPTDAKAIEAEIRTARERKKELDSSLSVQVGQIDRTAERAIEEIHSTRDARVAELQEEIQRVREDASERIEEARGKASGARQKIQAEIQPKMAELDREVAALEERARSVRQALATRQVMEEAQEAADQHKARSEELTGILTALDALKLQLQDSIPIEGVSIEGGDVHVDGVPFHRVNNQRQVEVAVALAKLRAGKIPLVCVDQLECLEQPIFDEFVRQLAESGLQPILTRVTQGPLSIRSVDAAGASA